MSELKESRLRFVDKKGDYYFRMSLQNKGEEPKQVLKIKIANEKQMKRYDLKIDEQSIKEHTDLANIFVTPEELMQEIRHSFSDLEITEDGTIKMELSLGKIKRKEIQLKTVAKTLEKTDLLNIDAEKMKSEIKSQKEQLKNQNKKIEAQSQEINNLKKQNSEMKQEIQNIRKELNSQRQEIEDLQANKDLANDRLTKLSYDSHSKNPHKRSFDFIRTPDSLHVTRLDESNGTWTNFFLNYPLLQGKVYRFHLFQSKTKNRQIMFGIGSTALFGVESAYNKPDAMVYYTQSGKVWQCGTMKSGGAMIFDGKVIGLQIDLTKNKLTWTSEQTKPVSAPISEELLKKELYLTVMMLNQGDQVEIRLND